MFNVCPGCGEYSKANAHITRPPMTLCDTSHQNIDETVAFIAKWIRERL